MSNNTRSAQGQSSAGDPLRQPDGKLGETMAHGDTSSTGGVAPRAGQADQWIGRKIDRYLVRELLGTGGMGVVFLAHDTMIERDVAIKMLPEELSSSQNALGRFLAEAKSAGKIAHANVVSIYEIDQHENSYYLVMEYVGGGTIATELERGPLSVLAATKILADACRGLAAAHAVGLVHRDIKPANLLRSHDGAVKIADFGLAKQTLGATLNLTQEGSVAGTPYFMSPEQCEALPVDSRSDIYSLGATYYSLLSGEHPYQDAGSIVQIMFAHVKGPPLDPRKVNPSVPRACCEIVQRATAKRPEDRYQSAAEMLADLEAVIATLSGAEIQLPSHTGVGPAVRMPSTTLAPAVPTRRNWLIAAGLAAVGLAAGLGGFAVLRDSGEARQPDPALPVVLSGEPIRVGVLHSLSGSMEESESPVVDATLLAIDELNASGGVLGRPVEAVVRDGRSNSQAFAEEAENLLTKENVCTVFGCWTSADRKTIVPIIERHNNLLVYPVQYEGLEQSPNVIYLGATPNQQIIPALDWLYAFQRKRKFFLVGSDYVFPRTAGAIIRDELKQLGGEVVGEAYLPLGSYDVQKVVDQIVAAKPDVILNTINGDTNVPFFRRLHAAGITSDKIPTISFSIGGPELRHFDRGTLAGDFAAWSYFQSLDTLDNQRFVSLFQEKYGSQRVLNDPMEAAYIGVKLWAAAVQQAGSTDPEKIRAAFVQQKIMAPEGEVRIDPATQHAYRTPRMGRITADNDFEVVSSDVKPEPPRPFPPSRSRAEWEKFLADLHTQWGGRWSAPAK